MNFFFVLLIFKYLSAVKTEDVNEETRESLPILLSSEINKTNTTATVATKDAGFSLETLSELHDLAKNISHSKGIYREASKEISHDQELRRSIVKKVTVASESDAMKDILERLNSDENKLELLHQLEFLVHQFDVAVNFAAAGGLEIIMPLLFSPDDETVSSVASVLGAAMQSNPTVQQSAMKHNIGRKLLDLLSHKSPNILPRIIFAISSLLRNAPKAQEEFLTIDGISKLAQILKNHQIATYIKLKIINLFSDLAVEQQAIEMYPGSRSPEEVQKFKRIFGYEIQHNFVCKIIPSFLDLEDFDTHQKIVTAMISLHSICNNDFKAKDINNRLSKLLKIYDPDSNDENPLYPNIDKELKQTLYSDMKTLYKKSDENSSEIVTESIIKIEL